MRVEGGGGGGGGGIHRSSQTGDAGAVRKAREEEEEGRNHHTCESLLRLTLAPGTLSSVHKKKVAHLGLTNL